MFKVPVKILLAPVALLATLSLSYTTAGVAVADQNSVQSSESAMDSGLNKLYDFNSFTYRSQLVVTSSSGVSVHSLETAGPLKTMMKDLGLKAKDYRTADGEKLDPTLILENSKQLLIFQKEYDSREFETIELSYPTKEIYSTELEEDESEVIQEGQPGSAIKTMVFNESTKEFIETITVIKAPQSEQVLRGSSEEVAGEPAIIELPDSFSGELASPLKNFVYTSSYGMRVHPVTGVYKLHDGTDMAASCGTPIYSAADGVVVSAKYETGYGNRIIIAHGDGVETSYAHLSEFTALVGDQVKVGDHIGAVGTTGWSTGCHLHFMLSIHGNVQNPEPYLP